MASTGELVPEVLAEYGELSRATLQAGLETAAAWDPVYAIAADYPLRGGRALRASYCIAAARAFGASIDEAAESAISLELLHSAFLVRDDVEDGSEERRGRPTLHRIHGVATAVNAGDALTVLGLLPLLRNRWMLGGPVALAIVQEAERMMRESVEGQALELRWRSANEIDLDEDDYLHMVLKKTCWYTTIYPSRVGTIIGTRDVTNLDRFIRFGFFLGAAFQVQDDLLNLLGEHGKYGKELNGDILEGKRTLMLIHLLKRSSDRDRIRLKRFLALPREGRTSKDVAWIRRGMDRSGAIDHARRYAHALAGAASHEFRTAYGDAPESRDKRFIASLPQWVLERK